MTHYEERLQRDLTTIREALGVTAARIEDALRAAAHAVLTLDQDTATRTILGDLTINREIRALDRRCHAFIAQHLPSAGHLRFISSVLRLNVALERIGDYAVTISREALQLTAPAPDTVRGDIEVLATQSRRVFHDAMLAFESGNAERARGTKGMVGQVAVTFDKILDDLIRAGEREDRPLKDLFALLVTFNRLERVADQAKNICEETVFAATGESKAPKVYRILFLDERNDGTGVMAEAYARKAFPESASYTSAGWNPAGEIDPEVLNFMDGRGFNLRGLSPRAFVSTHDEVSRYHFIIGLDDDPRKRIADMPFHTLALTWSIGRNDDHNVTLQRVSAELRDLMEQLHGDGAR